mmetsp:Transcript_18559/g.47177  ORF Transcript_18559/g.47177 Transcript_18559/m.47177 type:complete len:187 (-) Transcript_18559:1917-2477(-)|eukprot:CAMPEP_0177630500 /NCGR_PEP_ID=MMETSP0447-20121125/1242_1 /TAXON_ID=0 /ORGANISM="Stygamoeba regulata, Strain BSH-02190019" /LENGTH=186 /DNA_ID=CAMNT_0019131907 /DNA_START=103 /DNA_END=663 /DNA_ORIENTATION=+
MLRSFFPFVFLLVLASACVASVCACPDVPVVASFDVTRYMGKYYEIATSPSSRNTFERGCECTFAQYSLRSDGTVAVNNTCSRHGAVDSALGTATIPDPTQPAKLAVSFGGPPGPYWVIELGPNYEYSVVWSCTAVPVLGDVDYMWVLSRQPTMDEQLYQQLLKRAQALTGFDVTRMTRTRQNCGF